jgi:hypothetical protein
MEPIPQSLVMAKDGIFRSESRLCRVFERMMRRRHWASFEILGEALIYNPLDLSSKCGTFH